MCVFPESTGELVTPYQPVPEQLCWACGKVALADLSGFGPPRYRCTCGCGWVGGKPEDPIVEARRLAERERIMARQWDVVMVDFTQPDAISAPA